MARLGFPIVLSAPSGTGKTTLAHLLVNSMKNLSLSVSYTTRVMRGNEQSGISYNFVSEDAFEEMIKHSNFIEWAKVHGHYYGSSLVWTTEKLNAGIDVIFDIDVQGGLQIKKRFKDAVTIFIVPPSLEELEKRLTLRGTEDKEKIASRMKASKNEIITGLENYDYVINNENLERALFDLTAIIRTHYILAIDREKIKQRLLGH